MTIALLSKNKIVGYLAGDMHQKVAEKPNVKSNAKSNAKSNEGEELTYVDDVESTLKWAKERKVAVEFDSVEAFTDEVAEKMMAADQAEFEKRQTEFLASDEFKNTLAWAKEKARAEAKSKADFLKSQAT